MGAGTVAVLQDLDAAVDEIQNAVVDAEASKCPGDASAQQAIVSIERAEARLQNVKQTLE
jgi:hypothetical protein